MPVYKNKDNGTWYVMTQYTDWKGERKPKCKVFQGCNIAKAGTSATLQCSFFGK